MKTYILFGIADGNLDDARRAIEAALGIRMVLHESDYRGGDYYRSGDVGAEHFILQRNFDEHDDEWSEPDFPKHCLLLYASDTSRGAELEMAMTGIADVLSTKYV